MDKLRAPPEILIEEKSIIYKQITAGFSYRYKALCRK